MKKALLMSILVATVVVPMMAAKAPSLRAAVTRTAVGMAVASALYWLALIYVYPAL